MRPNECRDSGQEDLFRARLDQIVDFGSLLAKLARSVDWAFLEERFGSVYSDKADHPPLPARLMARLAIRKPPANPAAQAGRAFFEAGFFDHRLASAATSALSMSASRRLGWKSSPTHDISSRRSWSGSSRSSINSA